RSATAKPAICTSLADPDMISFIAQPVSAEVSDSPPSRALISADQVRRGLFAVVFTMLSRSVVALLGRLAPTVPGPGAPPAGPRGPLLSRSSAPCGRRTGAPSPSGEVRAVVPGTAEAGGEAEG